MPHFLVTLGQNVIAPLLVAGILFFGQRINKHLSQMAALPKVIEELAAAHKELAAAVKSWDKYRLVTDERLDILENRQDQQSRILANQHQRITIVETKVSK